MKQCNEYFEKISSFVDGALSETEQIDLFIHLETCPSCSKILEMYQDMSGAFDHVDVAPPAGFSGRVMEQVTQAAHVPPIKARRRGTAIRRFVAVAAVFAVVAVLGFGTLLNNFGGSNVDMAPMTSMLQPTERGSAAEMPVPTAMPEAVPEMISAAPPEATEDSEEFEDADTAEEEEWGNIHHLTAAPDTRLLETVFPNAPWQWDALSNLFAEAGYLADLFEGGVFEVRDPYNPGSLLYGQLDSDILYVTDVTGVTVRMMGYHLSTDTVDRRVEIRMQDGATLYYYNVTAPWEGGIRGANWESLRQFIVHG